MLCMEPIYSCSSIFHSLVKPLVDDFGESIDVWIGRGRCARPGQVDVGENASAALDERNSFFAGEWGQHFLRSVIE